MFVRHGRDREDKGFRASFKDLSRYIQLGEDGEGKPQRVLFAESGNINASDPFEGWREMEFISDNARAIKQDAKRRGLLAKNARVDHVEATPAWHVVLSWHPTDKPTRETAREAVKSFLAFHGLQDHQYIWAMHGDGNAPHLHIMVNLLDTGTACSVKRHLTRVEGKGQITLKHRSQDWAAQWAKDHPHERDCPQRAVNAEKRKQNALTWAAHRALNATRRAMGRGPVPAPKLQRTYDKSPSRNVWQLMRSAARIVRGIMAGHPDAEKVAADTAAKFAQVHRKAAAQMLKGIDAARGGAVSADREAIAGILRAATGSQSVFTHKDLLRVIRDRLGPHHTEAREKSLLAAVQTSGELLPIEGGEGEDAWVFQKGGLEGLSPEQRDRAEIAWRAWREAETWHSFALPEYVDYVQARNESQPKDAPRLYTSREMRGVEVSMLTTARELAGAYSHRVGEKIAADIQAKAKRDGLNAGQLAALAHVTSGAGLACVEGLAGTGKSFMLKYAREAWQAQGFNLIGLGYSKTAAKELQNGSGIKSMTLAALDWHIENRGLSFTSKDIFVVDEAGMLGSRMTAKLLARAKAAGAAVVLVGDRAQHQTMQAGGAFAALVDDSAIGAARMSEIIRQGSHVRGDKAAWDSYAWARKASEDFAQGGEGTRRAAAAYAARGMVKASDTREDARARIVAEYVDYMRGNPGLSGLMMAATKDQVKALNLETRAALKAAGGLKGGGVQEFVLEAPDQEPEKFALEIAVGERLMFTKNDKTMDVQNGSLGTLERAAGASLTIRLDGKDARRVVVDLKKYKNLTYGYAATTMKNQGVTCDRAWMLAHKGWCDAHAVYVGMSRHRREASLHFGRDDFKDSAALLRQISRQHMKETSFDYMDRPETTAHRKRAFRDNMRMLMKHGAMIRGTQAKQQRHEQARDSGRGLSAGPNPRTSGKPSGRPTGRGGRGRGLM